MVNLDVGVNFTKNLCKVVVSFFKLKMYVWLSITIVLIACSGFYYFHGMFSMLQNRSQIVKYIEKYNSIELICNKKTGVLEGAEKAQTVLQIIESFSANSPQLKNFHHFAAEQYWRTQNMQLECGYNNLKV